MPTTGCILDGGSPNAASITSDAAPTNRRLCARVRTGPLRLLIACSLPWSSRPGAGRRSIPCANVPRDVDRARHRSGRSRRRAPAHRPAAAQPGGAPAPSRAAAGGRGAARPGRRSAHASPPRPPRSALPAAGRARRADHRPEGRGAHVAAARVQRGARDRRRREGRRRRVVTCRPPRRAITAAAASAGRARPRARLRHHGHAPHLPRGRHRSLRRDAGDRPIRARPGSRAHLGLGLAPGPRASRSRWRGSSARVAGAAPRSADPLGHLLGRASRAPDAGLPARAARRVPGSRPRGGAGGRGRAARAGRVARPDRH